MNFFAFGSLVDGMNVTMSDEHMWIVPFSEGEDHLLVVDLGAEIEVSGLRMWNYNKAPDDTLRGVSLMSRIENSFSNSYG